MLVMVCNPRAVVARGFRRQAAQYRVGYLPMKGNPVKLANRNIPSQFQNSGVTEVISYRFYDTLTILNGATQDLTAFASAAINDQLGNFEGAGAMPAGQAFHVQSLRLFINPAAAVADALAITTSVLKFTKENAKKYAWAPINLFPAGVGLTNDAAPGAAAPLAPATGISFVNNGVPVYGNCYKMKSVTLLPQQNFKVIITPYAPVLTASVTVRVIMEGMLERNLI
jgi:hypothetical protein